MEKIYRFYALLLITVLIYGCFDTEESSIDVEEMTIENAIIPSDFDYSTQNGVTVRLTVPENLKNAVVSLCTYEPDKDSLRFARASFDSEGYFESTYSVPSYIDTIMVVSDYLGLVKQVKIGIEDNVAEYDYTSLYEDDNSATAYIFPEQLKSATGSGFSYMGKYNYYGVPKYLESRDEIEQNLLDDINASLPEGSRLPNSHPEYLDENNSTDIILTKQADVWVTFVTEGAGWKNSLGYYTYEVGNEPQSASDIEKLNIIFPNVSQSGSGGGLIPGDKVHLGQFPANTGIGWFLVANGWWYGQVITGNGIHYSQNDFNSESTASLRQHMVTLYDKSREQFILGFEDVPRNWSMCDDDFNDAIFYATANPVSAIKKDNVSEITAANDSDGDGINDELDDFPYDPDKSFNNFSPSEQSNGTLAFEDLWPSKGDYDFNDCVIDYNFNLIANARNKVKSIEATIKIEHIGASFHNGFAIEIPIEANKVKSVEGCVLNEGYISVNSNGTESGVDYAVIVIAENVSPLEDETITITIDLKSAISKDDLGQVPFNPFIIVDGDRSREIHLADMAPTSKGTSMLGTKDDYSDASKERYFKTNRNLPWAINIYEDFEVSPERTSIDVTYPKFITWANSGGTIEKDWYR